MDLTGRAGLLALTSHVPRDLMLSRAWRQARVAVGLGSLVRRFS
jgi:hypothetical protein